MRHIICDGMQTRRHLRLLTIGSTFAFACSMPLIAAAAPPSCKSITKGTLDVELPAGQRSSRMVRLSQGEIVNFSVHSGASEATVTLVSGAGSPQVVLAPGAKSIASFQAPENATYVFAIEAGRDNLATVSANCSKANPADEVVAARTDITVAQLEADAEGLARRSAFSLGLSEFAATARAAESPVNRWADASTEAPALDTAGTQDDVVSSTLLSFAANADVGAEDLDTVMARVDRVGPAATDGETQVAMTWSAILTPQLSFDVPNDAKGSGAKRVARKGVAEAPKLQEIASATPAEGWWVTHLEDNRGSEPVVTETAVLRRDMVAGTAFPAPMALGAFVPTEGLAAPVAPQQ